MKICVLSVSRIADDARVLRHSLALAQAGHTVVAVGLRGARSPAPEFPLVSIEPPLMTLPSKAVIGTLQALGGASAASAEMAYALRPFNRRLFAAARAVDAEVFHANDWATLPVAARLARERGGVYVYDSHEYGVGEGIERPLWRWTFPRYVRQLEQRFIGGAAFVTTVSEGVAALLQRDYGLADRPIVIRNLPLDRKFPLRAPGREIAVLYHGILSRDRGLEDLVRSVAAWRADYSLVLRGGDDRNAERLRHLARDLGLGDRVRVEPAVPPGDVVARAHEADIGMLPMAPRKDQIRLALPNKLFEYLTAGLAICAVDGTDMARFVRDHDLGPIVPAADPRSFAAAINGLDRETVLRHKANALAMAPQYRWDDEREILLGLYERLRLISRSLSVTG